MRYQIESIEDLIRAISYASDNDTIDGQGIILEVKYNNFALDKKLKIENICFDKIWKNDRITLLAHDSLEIDNCTFITNNYKDGKITFVYADGGNEQTLDINNSKFVNSNYIGVQTFNCGVAHIMDCVFHYDSPTTHGYGVWQGGSGSAVNQELKVHHSKFYSTRHAIAGHYNANHIDVEDCQFINNVKHVLDRHSGVPGNSGAFGYGGGDYRIAGNIFHDMDRFALSAPIPLDGHKIIVENNVFSRPTGKAFEIEMDIDGEKELIRDNEVDHPQVIIEYNKYTLE